MNSRADSPSALKAWTVQELSELTGISRSAFTRRFTKSVGKPPMAYLIGWRLLTAARLLRESDAPLAAVARQVGYSSEFAFAGAFRREFGISPGRFRVRDTAPEPKVSIVSLGGQNVPGSAGAVTGILAR